MNNKYGLHTALAIAMGMMMAACVDDDKFSAAPGNVLSFSVDTVRLDTTFSNVPTTTKTVWVYNRSGSGVRCASVRLENGNQTGFRVNVDGTYIGADVGFQTQDVEIRKGDSIRVFVELTSATQHQDAPQLVQDNLVFGLESGTLQKLNLKAYSWDATLLSNVRVSHDSTIVGGGKPIVIYGGIKVEEPATLTISEGTTLYFHENAGMDVYGKLKSDGKAGAEVVLRGDRIDHLFDYLPYDRTPGQWQGIRFHKNSFDNELSYTDIHSAYDGVMIDSSDVSRQKLLMQNVTVHNCQGYGVYIDSAKVQMNSCLLSNTQNHCLYVYGGDVEMNQCTLAQFYPFTERASAIGFRAPVPRLKVVNSLVTGYADDEVVWIPVEDQPLNFSFDHSVLRTVKMDSEDSLKFTNVVYEAVDDTTKFGEKHFKTMDTKNFVYDFHLRNTSAAIGVADVATALPADRDGYIRKAEEADAGCYEHRDEEK